MSNLDLVVLKLRENPKKPYAIIGKELGMNSIKVRHLVAVAKKKGVLDRTKDYGLRACDCSYEEKLELLWDAIKNEKEWLNYEQAWSLMRKHSIPGLMRGVFPLNVASLLRSMKALDLLETAQLNERCLYYRIKPVVLPEGGFQAHVLSKRAALIVSQREGLNSGTTESGQL